MWQQTELVANGEVRIVVEGKKLDQHNLVLTKSIFLLAAFQAHIWRDTVESKVERGPNVLTYFIFSKRQPNVDLQQQVLVTYQV